jgi:hypothetical protein
LGFVD